MNYIPNTDADRAAIERRVRAINPVARLITSENADVPMQELLGVEAFELERALSLDPGFLAEEHAHEHDDAVGSVALVDERPMDLEKLGLWLSDLVAERGPDLFRMKGIIQLQGEARRYVFQSVHMLLDGDFDRLFRRQRFPSFSQRLSVDKFHRNKELSVMFINTKDRADVRMAQGRSGFCFLDKPCFVRLGRIEM